MTLYTHPDMSGCARRTTWWPSAARAGWYVWGFEAAGKTVTRYLAH